MATPPRAGGSGGLDRNTIVFVVITIVFLFAYDFLVAGPQRQAALKAQQHQAQVQQQEKTVITRPLDRSAALAAVPRAMLENARISGSISLLGARFDDLALKDYRQTTAANSADVTLFNPMTAKGGYDAFFAWRDPYTNEDVVAALTPWNAPQGARLTPQTPLTLTYATADGLVFTRTVGLDDRYAFTVTDKVVNAGGQRRVIAPFSVVRRRDLPADFVPNGIVHQGLVGNIGAKNFNDVPYQNAEKQARQKREGKIAMGDALLDQKAVGGWLGISDHYWLGALIPPQNENIEVRFDAKPVNGYTDIRASYWGQPRAIDPGGSITYTQHLFGGAKRVDVLQDYQKSLTAPDFDKAVDWGNFWILTRPFFWLLDNLAKIAGSFGVAILLTTIVVKALLFPLVNSSFEAMSKLRKVQPKMKEIQERFAADRERQQQEMMKLYQTEKINPLAGCLPILAQIPVFFALYKTLSVTIEMRHAPFLWLKDLSAPDPLNLFNLFGLLPFEPIVPLLNIHLALGLLAILYGLSMFATTSLSPPAPDPTQQMVFRLMPIVMTFMFAGFAAGLVLYWTWSNILSFAQQYVIMRKNGVETEVDKLFKRYLGKSAPS